MKLLRLLGRSIRDAFRSVIRNFSLSLASISCITITLIVVSIAMIASYNVDNFTKLMKKDVTIVAFLENDVTPKEIEAVENQIRLIVNVDTYIFQSKDEIKQLMRESSEVFNRIMSAWDEKSNPLQDTFLIKVLNVEEIKNTAKEIDDIKNVSVVKYGEGMIEKLLSIFDIVEKGTIGLVLGLVLVTAFLIANTIKITIFSRQKEIEIMRLVGSSNMVIKFPFIFEGLFLGILGSIIPIAFSIYGYYIFYQEFDGQLFSPFLRFVKPGPFIYFVALILLGLGMFLGMWGSGRAVRRHLKI